MLINTGNISRKVLSKVLRSFDKNFERLQKRLYLKGLDAEKQYRIEGKNQIKYGGDELMYTGMVIEKKTLCPSGTDYSSEVFYLQEE